MELNGRMIQCKGFGSRRVARGERVGAAAPGGSKMNMLI
jgi:hypothetical protein